MAKKGGKQPGAGRPKGSTTRPQIRDYFTEEEIEALIATIKTKMTTDIRLFVHVVEQIFGKAAQTVETPDGKQHPIVFMPVQLIEKYELKSK